MGIGKKVPVLPEREQHTDRPLEKSVHGSLREAREHALPSSHTGYKGD